jgi:hypothetical protein
MVKGITTNTKGAGVAYMLYKFRWQNFYHNIDWY